MGEDEYALAERLCGRWKPHGGFPSRRREFKIRDDGGGEEDWDRETMGRMWSVALRSCVKFRATGNEVDYCLRSVLTLLRANQFIFN